MSRYNQHIYRPVAELDGIWDFVFLQDADPALVKLAGLEFPDRMAVPGCFDATPAYAGKRGLAAYRTRLFLPGDGRYRLVFGGVNHWCSVWVAGEKVLEHSGGYSRFWADFDRSGAGEVDLVVLVDNRFDPARAPLHYDYFDWYQYGGITRPVELQFLGDTWINALRVVTEDYIDRRVSVTLDYASLRYPQSGRLSLAFDDQEILAEEVNIEAASGRIRREFTLPDAALWSPEAPELHYFHARLGNDDLRERVGLRQVQAAGQDILINGQSLRLLGFNRHEAHPQFGCALPDQIIVADVQQLRHLGCNFVRGSHYPQDERFLDLCDEAGLCVWDETIGWQHPTEHLTDPRFIEAQQAQAAEMVAMAFNHPSVVMYGLLNESASNDPACRPAYQALIANLRGLDPSRLITYASNHPGDDVCLDLVDVVSINTYPGWYFGSIEEIRATIGEIMANIDAAHDHASDLDQGDLRDRPVIISEIGAEAIYGWRDMNADRWSEQYQASLPDTVIRHLFVDRRRVVGLAIWLYSDFRTNNELPRMLYRARGFNNKGVVDEYRRPKQAYEVVRAHYRALNEAG